jgi:hypothetical protein
MSARTHAVDLQIIKLRRCEEGLADQLYLIEVLPSARQRRAVNEDPRVVNQWGSDCADQEENACKPLVPQMQALTYTLLERRAVEKTENGVHLRVILIDKIK